MISRQLVNENKRMKRSRCFLFYSAFLVLDNKSTNQLRGRERNVVGQGTRQETLYYVLLEPK